MVVLLDLSNERSYHKKNGIAHVDHLRRQRSDQNYSSFLHTQTPSAENFCQQGQDEQQQQPSLSHTSNESIAFNKAERGNNCACDNSEEHCYHELNGSASGGEIADDDEGNDNGRNDGNVSGAKMNVTSNHAEKKIVSGEDNDLRPKHEYLFKSVGLLSVRFLILHFQVLSELSLWLRNFLFLLLTFPFFGAQYHP